MVMTTPAVFPWRQRPVRETRGFVSPAVRNVAAEVGVDPAALLGRGEGGRVTLADVLAASNRPVARDEVVPFDNIRFVQGDTDAVPFGRGTYASRSMQVGGGAKRSEGESLLRMEELGKQIKVMVPPPGQMINGTVGGWRGYSVIGDWMQRILDGKASVRDAMDQAAREVDEVIAEAMR